MTLSALRRDAALAGNCHSKRSGMLPELPNHQLGGFPCEGSIRP
jgi:hypothetical protein